MRILIVVFSLLLLLGVGFFISFFPIKQENGLSEFEKQHISIGKNEFTLYIADTLEKQERGLMFVKELPQNEGMLFAFKQSFQRASAKATGGKPTFYNKNTFIPLDILWIADGIVKEISFLPAIKDTNIVYLAPSEPVDSVIELNAGSVEKYNIKTGDLMSGF